MTHRGNSEGPDAHARRSSGANNLPIWYITPPISAQPGIAMLTTNAGAKLDTALRRIWRRTQRSQAQISADQAGGAALAVAWAARSRSSEGTRAAAEPCGPMWAASRAGRSRGGFGAGTHRRSASVTASHRRLRQEADT